MSNNVKPVDRKYIPEYPINLMIGFQLLTVFLFFFGPRTWKNVSEIGVLLYVLLNCIFLKLGYKSFSKRVRQYKCEPEIQVARKKSYDWLNLMIFFSMIILFIDMINTIKISSFSFQAIIDAIKLGINSPNEAYYKESGIVIGGQFFTYLKVLTSPIVWVSIPFGLYFFRKINFLSKIILLINIALEALKWIGCGTNKGLFDLIFIFIAIVLIKIIENKPDRKKMTVITISIVVLLILGISYFSSAIGSRVGGNITYETEFYSLDTDNFLWKLCPDSLKGVFSYLLGYVTQGYYGLGLAFHETPTFMFGIGNSAFLTENIEQLFNIDLVQYTLQYKVFVTTGWHYTVNWHTIYTWLANDVTFYLVPLIMALIGNLFAKFIYDYKYYKNNLSFILCVLTIIGFAYFSANNQIMMYPTTAFTFIVYLALWIIKRSGRIKC